MAKIDTFSDMKELFQAGFDENVESLARFGEFHSTQLKSYLLENNFGSSVLQCPTNYGKWKKLGSSNWYVNDGGSSPGSFFIDKTRERVWVLYSLLSTNYSDAVVADWVFNTKGLDRCWLTRNHLMLFDKYSSWHEKGIGLRFLDGLAEDENSGKFSLKAWYGKSEKVKGLKKVIDVAKETFAVYSTRWQKMNDGSVSLSTEWYSNGKVTINRAMDVDEVLNSVSSMASKYEDSLLQATEARNNKKSSFELIFSQDVDLDAFSETVSMGRGIMNLWLVETESEPDFKRFRGVDLHTWDRIFLDLGINYAYLTIPGKGCVNAAPRIAALQGEDNAGKTTIFFDGDEMFA